MTVKPLGDAERLKLGAGAALTVTEMVVMAVALPDVPVMVTVAGPVAAVLLAVSVSVLVVRAETVAGFGLNDHVSPAGKPDADNVTLPLKPFCGVTEMLLVPLAPCVTGTVDGDADSVKLGAGGAGTPTETLSKVAVASAVVLPLVTARPTYTLAFMAMLWLALNCVQFTPSADT